MPVALLALIVALCSLIWNIVSALRSWRISLPLVKIAVSAINGSDGQEAGIDVQNRGGSPVAITSISIWTEWNMRKTDVEGFGISADVHNKQLPGIAGPRLPFTLNGRHSQDWIFDDGWVQRMKKEARTKKILIEVRLATGKSVYQTMHLSLFDIGDDEDESVEERPRGWVSRRETRLHNEGESAIIAGEQVSRPQALGQHASRMPLCGQRFP